MFGNLRLTELASRSASRKLLIFVERLYRVTAFFDAPVIFFHVQLL